MSNDKTAGSRFVSKVWVAALLIGLGLYGCGGGGGGGGSTATTDGAGAGAPPPPSGGVAPPPPPPPPPPPAVAGALCPTVPTPVPGAFGGGTVFMSASRNTGAGPLAVLFDVHAGIADLGATSAPTLTTRAFHDLQFQWDFEIPVLDGASVSAPVAWSFGRPGANRRVAHGPLAAHLFEAVPGAVAGTNDLIGVRLTVTGAGGASLFFECTIQVLDPDLFAWGGAVGGTLCVSDTGDFTGCPALATQTVNNDFDDVINSNTATTAANGANFKRILFRRDGVFTSSAVARIDQDGPGYVGAFGPGAARPVITGATGKLTLGNAMNHDFADWRFVDLDFDGVNQSQRAIAPSGGAGQITFARIVLRNVAIGIEAPISALDNIQAGLAVALTPLWAHWAVFDSAFTTNNSYGILAFLDKAMILGNQFSSPNPAAPGCATIEHCVRLSYARKTVITNNEFTAPNCTAGAGCPVPSLTALTVRGTFFLAADRLQGAQLIAQPPTIPDMAFTEQVVISDNKFIANTSGSPFTVKSVSDVEDTRIRDIIVERNWMVSGALSAVQFTTDAGEMTIRNNVFDLTHVPGVSYRAMEFRKSAGTPTQAANIFVYNNSAFSGTVDAASPVILVSITAAPTGVVVANNAAFAPNNTSPQTAMVGGGVGVTEMNNSSTAQITGGPNPFAAATPTVPPADWRAANYAIGGGTPLPVFSDYAAAPRTGDHIGAVNP